MFGTVPVPQKGDRITASWGASVANGVNALAPFAVAHGLVRQGATGNGSEPLPENRRNRTTATLPGCFEHAAGTPGEGGVIRYGRPYFMVGSRLYRAQDEDCACGTTAGIDYLSIELVEGEMSAAVEHADSYEDLQEEADDDDKAIVPLYELDAHGNPVADLRFMPHINAWEFST